MVVGQDEQSDGRYLRRARQAGSEAARAEDAGPGNIHAPAAGERRQYERRRELRERETVRDVHAAHLGAKSCGDRGAYRGA